MIMEVHHEWTIMITCSRHKRGVCTIQSPWKCNKSFPESWLFWVCHCYKHVHTLLCSASSRMIITFRSNLLLMVLNALRHHGGSNDAPRPNTTPAAGARRRAKSVWVPKKLSRAENRLMHHLIDSCFCINLAFIQIFHCHLLPIIMSLKCRNRCRLFNTKCQIVPFFDSKRFLSRHLLGAHASTKPPGT